MLNMVDMLVEMSGMDDFSKLVHHFLRMFWGVLGHKSVLDFS